MRAVLPRRVLSRQKRACRVLLTRTIKCYSTIFCNKECDRTEQIVAESTIDVKRKYKYYAGRISKIYDDYNTGKVDFLQRMNSNYKHNAHLIF